MKNFLSLIFIVISFASLAQLISGEIVDDSRKMTNKHPFLVEATAAGWAKYELAVNLKGNVTSARLIETSLKSTPSKMRLRNHAMGYTFEPGNHFPKFHHVIVKISSMKSTKLSPEEEKLLEGL